MIYKKNGPIVKVDGVNLKFDDRQILRDVSFEIQDITRADVCQGQIISVIGRSGIGKTQLFKILSGILKPNAGSVKVGTDLHEVKSGEVGIVPQNYILFNHRTILENLLISLRYCDTKHTKKEKTAIIEEYATRFELKEHLRKYPMQLSGGQKQRVSIIQQVLTGNRFILLDEPFSGLDALMIDKITELLINVSNMHELNTLFIVSHDIENSLAISDTAFILANEKDRHGATITETLDLMEMGLAWNPEIKKEKHFQDLVGNIKYKI